MEYYDYLIWRQETFFLILIFVIDNDNDYLLLWTKSIFYSKLKAMSIYVLEWSVKIYGSVLGTHHPSGDFWYEDLSEFGTWIFAFRYMSTGAQIFTHSTLHTHVRKLTLIEKSDILNIKRLERIGSLFYYITVHVAIFHRYSFNKNRSRL